MEKYLFFDTETNGLPTNFKASPKEVENWPRVIQLAFIVTDGGMNELFSYCELIKPEGWTIPDAKFWQDNGYTTETNEKEGVPINSALDEFSEKLKECKYLVAHNINFDHPIVSAEMIRKKMKVEFPNGKPEKICTMHSSTDYCQIPGRFGFKWPKLEELHTNLFGHSFDGAHDALEDVRATVRCFKELKNIGVIK